MNHTRPPKTSKDQNKVLVVGFNVRPLARSAKRAGFQVYAVDYWGDLDLPKWTDRFVAVLEQRTDYRPNRPLISTVQTLLAGVHQIIEEYGPMDYILVSGGFDDHPLEWKELSQLAYLAGNSSKVMKRARNRTLTTQLALKHGAANPKGDQISTTKEFHRTLNRLELPIVVKPLRGSGGFGSRILNSQRDIDHFLAVHKFNDVNPLLMQELIDGIDASVSVLSSEKDAMAVSLNEQLIGLPELGKGRTKAYCGNIVPLSIQKKQGLQIAQISENMALDLGLIGSNGFDFVLDKEMTPYFMEVNPRFQATIEAFELTTRQNLVQLHLQACQGVLPKKNIRHHKTCVRIIVYARQRCHIPDLQNFPGVVDISHPGSYADRGDPICTINHLGKNRTQALSGAWKVVYEIYQQLHPNLQILKSG